MPMDSLGLCHDRGGLICHSFKTSSGNKPSAICDANRRDGARRAKAADVFLGKGKDFRRRACGVKNRLLSFLHAAVPS